MMPPEFARVLDKMPEAQRARFLAALEAGWRIEHDWRKITARYRDIDLADAVPREIVYIDLGILAGRIDQLEAFLHKLGYHVQDDVDG
jgi:hypothetical protein